jgi:GAF domain-containing protein
MNIERLLREVEKRLPHLSDADRSEVVDAVREEIARERRRIDLGGTVEVERERRQEAETLREILEAINRQASLDETIGEVLKQLSRIVVFDSCSVALLEGDGRFRIIAGRGFEDEPAVVGLTFKDDISDILRNSTSPLSVDDMAEDERFERIAGTPGIRSWAGIPLLVEGDVIGLLCLDRRQVAPFDEEELHRAKAVAFSAAAAIRRAQLHEKVRRYATLMERVVQVDQAVFAGRPPEDIADLILEGALRVGEYPGGLLVLGGALGPRIAASRGGSLERGAPAPAAIVARESQRLDGAQMASLAGGEGLTESLYLVPLASADTHLGNLVLFDTNGPTADDLLMEAYASRAAAALRHATS